MQQTSTPRRAFLAGTASLAGLALFAPAAPRAQALGPSVRLVAPQRFDQPTGEVRIARDAPIHVAFEASPGARIDPASVRAEARGSRRVLGIEVTGTRDLTKEARALATEQGIRMPSLTSLAPDVPAGFVLTLSVADTAGRRTTVEWQVRVA